MNIFDAGLTPDRENANEGTQRGRGLLEKSLRKLGAGRSILTDKDGNVIAGNKTLETAADIDLPVRIVETDGNELVVVKRTDLDLYSETDKRARQLAYADNKITEVDLAWKPEQIAVDFEPLELKEWGFDDPNPPVADAEPQIDRAAELNEKWKVVAGDLWKIGKHRLLCGDSTKREDVERLLNGKNAFVYSDPPYGVSIVSTNKAQSTTESNGTYGFVGADGIVSVNAYAPIIGDDTTETAERFYKLCLEIGLNDFILWGGNYFTGFLPPSPCWLIWDKREEIPSNNFADCEIAWASFTKPSRIYRQLWSGLLRKGDRQFEGIKRLHPTQKPVELQTNIMIDFPADIYYDGFLGSGSFMVAAHNVGKKMYGIEKSVDYCAVILQRMSDAFPELTIERVVIQ